MVTAAPCGEDELPHFVCVAEGTGHANAVTAIAFAPKRGGFLASSGADTTLKLWDLQAVLEGSGQPSKLVTLKVRPRCPSPPMAVQVVMRP
jgi:WD40 repeat protein